MKEAAGEANMTVITIILIGVIVAIATPIVKGMMDQTSRKASCMNDGYCGYANNACTPCGGNGQTTTTTQTVIS